MDTPHGGDALEDLRDRLRALRGSTGAQDYYGTTFDAGVEAALAQLDTWAAALVSPMPDHPDVGRFGYDEEAHVRHVERRLRRLQEERERRRRGNSAD